MSIQPYTPAKIVNLGLDYKTQNLTDPPGWTKTDLAKAMRLGYAKAGLHNLRPSCKDWILAQLVYHNATHAPYVLDPTLRSFEEMFAKGFMEAEGFEPSAELLAEREKCVNKQSANAINVENLQKSLVNWRAKRDQPEIHLRAL